MNWQLKPDKDRLQIFHEGRKRRVFVGELTYDKANDIYTLTYDRNYAKSKNAIPIGPELDLFQLKHQSEKGKLFPSFIDRIPDKSNPAYEDYCKAQGISSSEENAIILLGAIGKRGPSSFIFEPVYYHEFNPADIIKLRNQLKITQHDLALALDLSKTTLQRIESGLSQDYNTLKRMQMIFIFPEVALWQLKQTGERIHRDVLAKLITYFELLYFIQELFVMLRQGRNISTKREIFGYELCFEDYDYHDKIRCGIRKNNKTVYEVCQSKKNEKAASLLLDKILEKVEQ